jgi:pimeloyl-ACP methyl ester carboxylesterase
VDLVGFGRSERPADFSYDLREQAELLAVRVVTVSDSGHAFSEDDPEGFGRAILQWL